MSALDVVLAGEGRATTLSGCLIRVGKGNASALICREPAACSGPVALTVGPVVWDRRWRICWPVGKEIPPGATLGALGVAGLTALAADPDWQPPAAWANAPRAVRETVPAIRLPDAAGGAGALLAVPHAGYLSATAGCTAMPELMAIRELP